MYIEYLKRKKEEVGITTKEWSERSEVPEGTINKILSGQTEKPSFEAISKLTYSVGGSLDEACGMEAHDPNTEIYLKTIADKNAQIKELGNTLAHREEWNDRLNRILGHRNDEIERLHGIIDTLNKDKTNAYKINTRFGAISILCIVAVAAMALVILGIT